jgi:hypothetical protein
MFDKTGDAGSAAAAPKLIPAFFVKVRVVQFSVHDVFLE